jgi:hypothetical protein
MEQGHPVGPEQAPVVRPAEPSLLLVPRRGTAASKIERPDGGFPQPPDLWWPEDRQWFVGGDTDLDWCYIAGSGHLISAVGAEFQGRTRPLDWTASNAAAGGQS